MAATAFGVGAVSQGGGRVKDGGEGRGKKKDTLNSQLRVPEEN